MDAVKKHKVIYLEPMNSIRQHSRQYELYGLIQYSPHILQTPQGGAKVDPGRCRICFTSEEP